MYDNVRMIMYVWLCMYDSYDYVYDYVCTIVYV